MVQLYQAPQQDLEIISKEKTERLQEPELSGQNFATAMNNLCQTKQGHCTHECIEAMTACSGPHKINTADPLV